MFPAPESVFTPRSPQINKEMYIDRPTIEERLKLALLGNKFIIIHGESGNGKTWLYKKVFEDKNVKFEIVNLASAILKDDVNSVFSEKLGELEREKKEKTETNIVSGARPWNVGVEVQNKTQNITFEKSHIAELFSEMRNRAGDHPAILVLDNFEQIEKSQKLVQQVASLLILVDDDYLSQFKVKIMIVGVPNNIRSLISKSSNASTISNRLVEIPEVARLSREQSVQLLKRGLEEKLGIENCFGNDLYEKMSWVTDCIAQHLHELGLAVAYNAIENGRKVDAVVLDKSIHDWASDSISSDCEVIERLMNSRETKLGRKNQTLYSIGLCDKNDFKYTDIEKILSSEFDVKGVTLNVSQILSEFSTSDNPIISRTTRGANTYRLVSPKYRMAIRSMLIKENNRVEKRKSPLA